MNNFIKLSVLLCFLLFTTIANAQIWRVGTTNSGDINLGATESFKISAGITTEPGLYSFTAAEAGCKFVWTVDNSGASFVGGNEGSQVTIEFNNIGTYEIKVSKNSCDDSWENEQPFALRFVEVFEVVITSSGNDFYSCSGGYPDNMPGCSIDPQLFMASHLPQVVAPENPQCEVELSSTIPAYVSYLNYLQNNFYEIENYNSSFTYDHYLYTWEPGSPQPANDFEYYFIYMSGGRQGISIVDNTTDTENYAILSSRAIYRGLYHCTNPYTGEDVTFGNPGWISTCAKVAVNSPCPSPIVDDEPSIYELLLQDYGIKPFNGSNTVNIKEPETKDLFISKEIELKIKESNNNDKLIFDWFVELPNGKGTKLVADNSLTINATVPGKYYSMAKSKHEIVLDVENNLLSVISPSTNYVGGTEKITIYNSSLATPTVTDLYCYPNPASENVSINYSYSGNVESAEISIYSDMGRNQSELVKEIFVKEQAGQLDISYLQPGTYYIYLVLKGGQASQTVTLLKQ